MKRLTIGATTNSFDGEVHLFLTGVTGYFEKACVVEVAIEKFFDTSPLQDILS